MNSNSPPNLRNKIIDTKEQLPKKQKDLCDYILKNFSTLGLVTIKELSDSAEVGISTVMRTIKALGYDNFNVFRKDIYNASVPDDSKWSLKKAIDEPSEDMDALVKVWGESVELLNRSLNETFMRDFRTAVDAITEADGINILGTRPYKAAAAYFEQVLGEFYPSIRQLNNDSETLFDKILQIKKDDILFVFAFEPYSNLVINAVKEAYAQNIKIILVTDYDSCPVISYSDVILKLSVSKNLFTISPIIALIDAIVLEIGKHYPDSVEKLQKLEETLNKNNVLYDS